MAICIILFLVAKIDCRTKTSAPSIHSSRVVSIAEGLVSSCAVVEEGVPVCQDPKEDNKYAILQVYSLNRITYIILCKVMIIIVRQLRQRATEVDVNNCQDLTRDIVRV